jgi:D-glycero-D-manno-heptose 1,7-bisphosphate phosphatase
VTVLRRAVFLDRDGVVTATIDRRGVPSVALAPDELVILPGVAAALGRLRAAGYVSVVVTNQPDVARGGLRADDLAAMHRTLAVELPIDHIEVCPHDGVEGCSCRKPKPGMLLTAGADLQLDLAHSWLVGDRWVDIAAGRGAGVRTLLVVEPYSWDATSSGSPPADLEPDGRVEGLAQAVDEILRYDGQARAKDTTS